MGFHNVIYYKVMLDVKGPVGIITLTLWIMKNDKPTYLMEFNEKKIMFTLNVLSCNGPERKKSNKQCL